MILLDRVVQVLFKQQRKVRTYAVKVEHGRRVGALLVRERSLNMAKAKGEWK